MKTINDLKEIAATLQLTVTGDRRCKYVWAQAITAYEATQAAIATVIDTTQAAYTLITPSAITALYWITFAIAFVFYAGRELASHQHDLRIAGKGLHFLPANSYSQKWYFGHDAGYANVHINSASFALFW